MRAVRVLAQDAGRVFISKERDLRGFICGVTLDLLRSGKPTNNAFVESLNSKFRAKYLNAR